MATATTLATTAIAIAPATVTATSTVGSMQPKQQQQQQSPLRGISIIIESEQPAKPAAAATVTGTATATAATGNNSNIESDEMSLKSQSMLLAFGDNSSGCSSTSINDSNLQLLQIDHASNVDLKTSCNIEATKTPAITTTTTTEPATMLYPQLLLRIGQTEAEVEAEAEEMTPAAAAATTITTASAAATTATAATPTIISCNVADVVRDLLQDQAATNAVAGEIEESTLHNDNHNNDASQLTSAVTETVAVCAPQHTVKIQIANNGQSLSPQRRLGKQISVVKLNDSQSDNNMILHINQEQQQQRQQLQLPLQQQQHHHQHHHHHHQQQQQEQQLPQTVSTPYQLCYLVSSGQYSPCETLDSGTGSDLESIKSPSSNSSSKGSNSNGNSNNSSNNSSVPKLELHLKTTRIRVNNSNGSNAMHLRAYSLTDSEECDESSSSLSCDSLHSNEAAPTMKLGALLPSSLLRDIRDRDRDREREREREREHNVIDELHSNRMEQARSQPIVVATKINGRPLQFEADQYYNFHVNEHANCRSFGQDHCNTRLTSYEPTFHSVGVIEQQQQQDEQQQEEEDVFAGYKDVRQPTVQAATIRSSKGTVRGVKNRVRNGVATFLQLQQPNLKNYLEKDLGKVVLYTTSMGIIRETYAKCANVKQILRTLLIKFEERDVFMSLEYQQEMRDRMHHDTIRVPQLFVEGQLIGDADIVERLNESGELRQLLRPYKSIATAYTCQTCGGYRLLPCSSCNGSKKSVHRNHFTAEFVALKCMNCDEVGLVKCPNC